MAVHAVVMAGGSGTRFWPLSTPDRPKQLLPLGPSPRSLLACTVERVAPIVPPDRVWVVTTERIADAVRADLPEVPAHQVLAEPVGRNTAPCIAWAAARIAAVDPDATLLVLPADHHIGDEAAFVDVLRTAIAASRDGSLVTCGIVPTRPETGYGYLELGAEVAPGVSRCARFVEKPDRARAESFLAAGNFLWNSGLFVFRAGALLASVQAYLPDLYDGLARLAAAAEAGREAELLGTLYPTLPSISIDHGVMEKSDRVLVVPGSFGWSDLGSYETAHELGDKDANGNVVRADATLVEARGNFVHAPPGKKVALLGVDDLVVVDTGDVLLVVPRARCQEVKRLQG